MRVLAALFLLLVAYCAHVVTSYQQSSYACDPREWTQGCKIVNRRCDCGYGCPSDFVYRTRIACQNKVKELNPNICHGQGPCMRGGLCIQTQQDPGYMCRCEGTGFYGLTCEKACPTTHVGGLVFPHECIVI